MLPACVPVAITAWSRRPLITFCTKRRVPLQSPSMGDMLRNSMTTMLGLRRRSCRGSPDSDSVLRNSGLMFVASFVSVTSSALCNGKYDVAA